VPILLRIHHMPHTLQHERALFTPARSMGMLTSQGLCPSNEGFGEGNSVLRAYRYHGPMRQWIAAAAAFALSLQLVLSSLAIGHLTARQAGTGDTFVICHGVGGSSPADQDGPAKQPSDQSHCFLCTLTNSGCAILPTASVVTFAPGTCSRYLTCHDAQVSEYHSPTGKFQRGPPLHTLAAG
jgi:hypothetical protein